MAKQANILSFDEAKRAARANRPSFAAPGETEPPLAIPSRRTQGTSSRQGSRSSSYRSSSHDFQGDKPPYDPYGRRVGGGRQSSVRDARFSAASGASRQAGSTSGRTASDRATSSRAASDRATSSRAASRGPSWLDDAPHESSARQASSRATRRSGGWDAFDQPRSVGCSTSAFADPGASAAPRRAVFDEQALAEEEGEETPRKKTMRDKLAAARKSRSKAKAERAFSRQFGQDGGASGASGASQAGPRAAVYKGEMGQSHRRASRMQNDAAPEQSPDKCTPRSKAASLKQSPKFIACMGALACVLFACLFLYGPAQQYYQSVREHDRLQAEYDAVAARNEALQAEVDVLGSDAGVESKAREDFGWVKEGEQAVVVYGLETSEGDAVGVNANIIPGSVEAPETWYSPVLDVVFGVK